MQAEAFLLMYLRQSFKSTLNFICKYTDFHRKSQILKQKTVFFQGYPDTEIKLGRNIFTVEKGFIIKMKTCKFTISYSNNAHLMAKNNTFISDANTSIP